MRNLLLLLCIFFSIFYIAIASLHNAHAADVTLEWDANYESDIKGYFIYYGLKSGCYSYSIDVGNCTSYTVSGLEDEVTYFFAATVYTFSAYESDYSNEVAYTPPGENELPPDCNQEVIELQRGWNLISLNRQPMNTDITAVLDSIHGEYKSVWLFEDGFWKVYNPENPQSASLGTIEVGHGYWINMREAGKLVVPVAEFFISSIELSEGWNMVSFHGPEAMNVTDALFSIDDVCISVWSYENDVWEVYNTSKPASSSLTIMEPGQGYWINVSESCTWTLP
ncbi:MAG TPA: fibronectin type III domain-containing protein [Syntrophales bacterium]|nr:fibronectin type III domain-containing protein [Syntrophales bacterium]HPQ45203.1 fibronectin type III domain-containing protein [Syntrophales bacterium]